MAALSLYEAVGDAEEPLLHGLLVISQGESYWSRTF